MNYQYGPDPNQYPPPYPMYQKPMPDPWRALIRKNSNIICFGMILVLLLAISLSPALGMIAGYYIDIFGVESLETVSSIYMLCDFFVTLIMFLIPMTIIRLWIGIPARAAFPMRRTRASVAFPAVLVCLAASVAGATVSALLSVLLETLYGVSPQMPALPHPVGIAAMVIYLIRTCLCPAVVEELLFRGVVMQSLRRFGDSFALVCSSILFSFAHYNLQQGPNALITGLVIGFFVLRTGSLRVGIAAHFINNLAAIGIELLANNFPGFDSGFANVIILAVYSVSGLIGIIMLSFNHSGIFRLVPSQYPVPEGRKYSLFFLSAVSIIYILAVITITLINFTFLY